MEDQQKGINIIQKITLLTNWFPNLLETQIDFIANTLSSIFIPSSFKSPPLSNSNTLDDSGSGSGRVQALNMVRKVGQGLLGAVYAGTVLSLMMLLSILLGVLLVNYWVEHPVVIREKLYFDYTDVNPEAMFVFRGRKDGKLHGGYNGVPVGHSFHVCVQFVFPDSDYNRDVGVYQLMAEVVSTNGKVIARSSQPSMLEFHSYPIRLMHTFIMSFPILLGLSRETQKMKVQMLRYKEDNNLRTEAIKITLMPRAGFPYLLPQIYEAEIIMHSKLPRLKELIHDWKWTFYVWTSLYFYIMLLLLLFSFFRSLLLFPIVQASDRLEGDEREAVAIRDESSEVRMREGKEFSETLRKWQQYRRKRKAALSSKSAFSEIVGSTSASSYTMIKEDPGPALEEHVGDSECSSSRPLW